MITTYIRSSSISSYNLCQFKWAMSYVFGIKEEANKAANIGNVVHKALELRANARLSTQNGLDSFLEHESKKTISVEDALDMEKALEFGFKIYIPEFSPREWADAWKMFTGVVDSGIYDPAKVRIMKPEQFFDLPIEEDWAKYRKVNPFTNKEEDFQLSIRGTVDLLTHPVDGVLHYIDWKTGRQWDWAKQKPKTRESLHEDEQLLLYYYAIRRLYPNHHVIMTIYYIVGDGPITLDFDDSHMDRALDMIKKSFLAMLNNDSPERMMDKVGPNKQPCSFCSFKKAYKPFSGKNKCDYHWEELQQLGVDKMMQKHNNEKSLKTYSGGGGVSGERE